MNRFNRALSAALTLVSLAAPGLAVALAEDREQPIEISADRAERDEGQGTTTYAGGVVMQQGSMRIDATEVIIYNDRNKVTKIVALGEPAQYQQKPSADDGLVVAQAQRLEYDIAAETLRLIEGASLKQEGTSLSGNRIDYDVRRAVVKAGSNEAQTERVRMVIPPRALKYGDEDDE